MLVRLIGLSRTRLQTGESERSVVGGRSRGGQMVITANDNDQVRIVEVVQL